MFNSIPCPLTKIRLAALSCTLLFAPGLIWAQAATGSAGEIEFARGVGFAQTPGQAPRSLGKGLVVKEGDRLTTADGASAILKLQDGTRMTVRPNSELVLSQFKYREGAVDNSLVMGLLRGGLRAITGVIAKGGPNAARITTPTATIGIRGTDFDARLCRTDCGNEAQRVAEKQRPNAVLASAKVLQLKGELNAADAQGNRRRVVDGGSVYPGDMIETGGATSAVLAFRDDSKITLGGATRFRVDSFVYDDKNPSEGRFLVSLLRGSVRALTGLIAKNNNRNVSFTTPTATIGIRGTGFDASCNDEGCQFFNWLGAITLTPQGSDLIQALQAGQGFFIGPRGISPITTSPVDGLPRPDSVIVNNQQLFSGTNVPEQQEGLFVFVRDGHIEVATAREILHLGRGETGFAGDDGGTARPNFTPRFIDFDRLPLPNSRNPVIGGLLTDAGFGTRPGVCK